MMDAVNPALQQLTIAERIGEMELSSRRGGVRAAAPLQTDSFAVLLVQGLESNDAHILNVSVFPSLSGSMGSSDAWKLTSTLLFLLFQKVLQTHKETVIKKTVAQLPLPAVLPLVNEVSPVFVNHPKKRIFFSF